MFFAKVRTCLLYTSRDELAQEKFGVTYAELNDAQQKAVREVYPQRISEAEPKKYGEKKK